MSAFKRFTPEDQFDNVLILHPSYDVTSGSQGWRGSPEGSSSMSLYGDAHWTARTGRSSNEGREFSPEWRANMSAAQTGKTYPNRKGQSVIELNSGRVFARAVDASCELGISKSTVTRCCQDGIKRQGLRFSYVDGPSIP